jgi:hypothetical protein
VFQNVGNTKINDVDIICILLLKGNVLLVIYSLLLWVTTVFFDCRLGPYVGALTGIIYVVK